MIFDRIEFSDIKSEKIRVRLVEFLEANHKPDWVPVYRFKIYDQLENDIGTIEFRSGNTKKIKEVDGHIGYKIQEKYRGHKHSLNALKAILPFIWNHPIDELVLTTDIGNTASSKIPTGWTRNFCAPIPWALGVHENFTNTINSVFYLRMRKEKQ